jgi:predicted SprT family Zn-dependent metalloprotease
MIKKFDINEYFKIKKRIESCDALYAALYNIADIEYSTSIETACISKNNSATLNMLINPKFWEGLNEDEKTFIILHELYHVVYDHIKRIVDLGGDFNIGNIAADIVINHHIHEKIGIDRELFDWEKYCWVETCFPKGKVPTNMNMEFYYNKLYKEKLPEKILLGNHSAQENNKQEKKDKKNGASKLKNNGNDLINPEYFSNFFKSILEENSDLLNEVKKLLDKDSLGDEFKEYVTQIPGLGSGDVGESFKHEDSKAKPDFKKLLKMLIPKKSDISNIEDEDFVWAGRHRRYDSFLKKNANLSLPNVKYNDLPNYKNNKNKEVWIFIDSSGSCHDMLHVFSNIAMSLVKEKHVNCRAFSFGDDCEEIDAKNPYVQFYSGNDGGLDCIENKIREIMRYENVSYPDNVVVLSDGGVYFGMREEVLKPKNWILLINNDVSHLLTPPGGKYIHMDENFFKLDDEYKRNIKRRF